MMDKATVKVFFRKADNLLKNIGKQLTAPIDELIGPVEFFTSPELYFIYQHQCDEISVEELAGFMSKRCGELGIEYYDSNHVFDPSFNSLQERRSEFQVNIKDMLKSKLEFFENNGLIMFDKNHDFFRLVEGAMTPLPGGRTPIEGCDNLFHAHGGIAKIYKP